MSETGNSVDWSTLRNELLSDDEQAEVAATLPEYRAWADRQIAAHRLAEIRKLQATTQVALAEAMGVSQSRISAIENGELNRTEVATLAAYIEALGGKLRLVADFGSEQVIVA